MSPRCMAIPVILRTTSGPAANTGTSGAMAAGSGSVRRPSTSTDRTR